MSESEMYEPRTPVVLASRVSTCERCDHRILVGEEIACVDGCWLHVDCADEWNHAGEAA